jgi:acetyl esterase/lipase
MRRRIEHRICAAIAILFVVEFGPARAQEKIAVYPTTENVTNAGFDTEPPFLVYYKPVADSSNGAAVLICPGGAYTTLADKHEGSDVARFFVRRGYAAFVLHYRLNRGDQKGHRFPDQFRDVTTAMRLIKSKAAGWKIDADRIGVMGFSAGGHLASMCGTMVLAEKKEARDPLEHWSSRPAFMILLYPVISLSSTYAHGYSAEMLLGKHPRAGLADSLSTQNRVTADTPPTFLVYSNDDAVVPPENGLLFYQALRRANVPASLHIYDHGGHGYGMAPGDKALSTWPDLCVDWLSRMGFDHRSAAK